MSKYEMNQSDPLSHQASLQIPGNYKDVLGLFDRYIGSDTGRTLDVGSNTTWFGSFIPDYWAVDVVRSLVETSRSYWVKTGRWSISESDQRVRVNELENKCLLPYEAHQFDTVILRDVLEHVSDPLLFFAEAKRVAKPGGIVFLSCPDSQRNVWRDPTHKRPYPLVAQRDLGKREGLELLYQGYESTISGTQKIASVFGGRSPILVRMLARFLWFWPRNAITIWRTVNSDKSQSR